MDLFHLEKGRVVFRSKGGVFAKLFLMARDESGKLSWAKLERVLAESKETGLSLLAPVEP